MIHCKQQKTEVHEDLQYSLKHRLDRVVVFFSNRPNWSPTPSPTGECVQFWFRWDTALAGGRGGGGIPIRTRGQTLWYPIGISVLCGLEVRCTRIQCKKCHRKRIFDWSIIAKLSLYSLTLTDSDLLKHYLWYNKRTLFTADAKTNKSGPISLIADWHLLYTSSKKDPQVKYTDLTQSLAHSKHSFSEPNGTHSQIKNTRQFPGSKIV